MKDNITTLFGLGKTPYSATTASAIGAGMYWVFFNHYPQILYFVFVAVFIISLIELAAHKTSAAADPREVVVDEWLGMFAALLIAHTGSLLSIGILFVVFRVLDIFKPFPFNILDKKLKSWWGLLVDDVVIGIVIGILFRVIVRFSS